MPKTSLLKAIQKAYRLSQLSQRHNISVDAIVERLQDNLTRRHLLKIGLTTASFTAATILRRENVVAKTRSSTPILIVGGGIAGLTAAYRLHQARVPVEVIEARSTCGGRMQTVYNALGTSIPVEMGGEFIDTGHSSLRSLAKELGFNLIDLKLAHKDLIHTTYHIGSQQVSFKQVVSEFTVIAKQIGRDAKATSDVSYKQNTPIAKELDNLSILEYLYRLKTPTVLRTILDIAYNVEFGLESSEQSALNLISLLNDQTSGFKIFGDSDERYYIEGGNQQIPQKLATILGDRISQNTVLQQIKLLSDGRYLVTMQSNDSKIVEKKYERVILAIPFAVLRHIPLKLNLTEVKKKAIDNLGYGSNSKLITSYDEKIWQNKYKATGDVFTDIGLQNTWESAGNRQTEGVGLLTNFRGGEPGVALGKSPLKKVREDFINQIEKVFPGIASIERENTPLLSYWINKNYSLGSYSCYRVGQYTTIRGAEGERIGNLFFIGEHTSMDFGGYMEGGCQTGNAVAKEIIKEI